MAKITRKTQKVFAVNANSNELAKFGSLKAGTPTYSSDPDVIQSSEYLAGLFGAVIGDNSPAIEDHNALFFLFARQLAYLFQQGIPEWDSATEYHLGSFCSVSTETGKIFVSKIDTNVNHNPTGTNWQLYWYSYDLNKLEKYTPFCVNSGNTDVNGNGDLVGFTGNTLSFKIGGSYDNMGLTSANGTHFTISSISDIDFSAAANGTYYFYIYPDGSVVYRATPLYRQKGAPSAISDFSGWLDTSKEQLNFYFGRNGTPPGTIIWGDSLDCVPFVKVVKTGGNITSVETLPFNYNGIGSLLIENYVNGTEWYNLYLRYDSNDQTIKTWKEQGGYFTITASVLATITFLVPFTNANYFLSRTVVSDKLNNTPYREIGIYTGSVSATQFQAQTPSTTYAAGFYWEAKGY